MAFQRCEALARRNPRLVRVILDIGKFIPVNLVLYRTFSHVKPKGNGRHSGAMPTGPRKARPDDRLRIEPGVSDHPGMTMGLEPGGRHCEEPLRRSNPFFFAW